MEKTEVLAKVVMGFAQEKFEAWITGVVEKCRRSSDSDPAKIRKLLLEIISEVVTEMRKEV